eukprot:11545436-Alexandrium_andersonii.AAC.1
MPESNCARASASLAAPGLQQVVAQPLESALAEAMRVHVGNAFFQPATAPSPGHGSPACWARPIGGARS